MDALAAQLGVEVEAAGREPAGPQDLVQRQRRGPPPSSGTGRCPSRSAGRPGWRRCCPNIPLAAAYATSWWKLWPASVAWLASMLIRYSPSRPCRTRKPWTVGDVVVVLVLGRLHRLGLDQQRALEADLVLVLGDQVEEAGELVALAPQVRVEERVVALAAAPQDVVLAAEPLGDLEHVLDLRRGVREHLGIGVRRRARLVARVGEQVRRAPQERDAGPLLVAGGVVGQRVEVRAERPRSRRPPGRRRGRGSSSTACRASRRTRTRRPASCARRPSGIGGRAEPRPVERADPNMSVPGQANECQKQTPEPEVVLHPLAEHEPVRLVDLERQGVVASRPPNGIRPGTSVKNASLTPAPPRPPLARRRRARPSLLDDITIPVVLDHAGPSNSTLVRPIRSAPGRMTPPPRTLTSPSAVGDAAPSDEPAPMRARYLASGGRATGAGTGARFPRPPPPLPPRRHAAAPRLPRRRLGPGRDVGAIWVLLTGRPSTSNAGTTTTSNPRAARAPPASGVPARW